MTSESIIGQRVRYVDGGKTRVGRVVDVDSIGWYLVHWDGDVYDSWVLASNCTLLNPQPEEAVGAAPDQPPPVKNEHPAIQDLVTEDIAERKRVGIARYGTPLQPHNGRDALVDAYQEALDLTMYLRQAIYERDGQ